MEKQSWKVVIQNLALAIFSIYHVILYVYIGKSPLLIFLTFAIPGSLFFWQHRFDMRIMDVLRCMVGMNKNPKHYGYYLQGLIYGFITGWKLMIQNIFIFFKERRGSH